MCISFSSNVRSLCSAQYYKTISPLSFQFIHTRFVWWHAKAQRVAEMQPFCLFCVSCAFAAGLRAAGRAGTPSR